MAPDSLELVTSSAGNEPTSLWRNREFSKFLGGQTLSLFGSQFSLLALPLTAVLVLHASPAQMGLLGATHFLPALVLGVFMGVWLDRVRRRPIIVGAQLVSMVALGAIPVSAALRVLTFGELYVAAFVIGAASSLFTIAQNAYLPTLVSRDHLVEANGRLQTARTIAQLTGPAVAGVVLQIVGAPRAIAVDALSFLVGAATAAWVRTTEPQPGVGRRRHVLAEAVEGLTFLWRQPLIRAIVVSLVLANLSTIVTDTVYFLLFVGRRGIAPSAIGFIAASGSLSALSGIRVATPIVERFGVGWVLIASLACLSLGELTTAVAAVAPGAAVLPLLVAGQVIGGVGLMVFNVNQVAYRQAATPDHLRGRVSAATLVLIWSATIIGALIGGTVGQAFGLRQAVAAGALLSTLCVGPLLLSPVRRLVRAATNEAPAARDSGRDPAGTAR